MRIISFFESALGFTHNKGVIQRYGSCCWFFILILILLFSSWSLAMAVDASEKRVSLQSGVDSSSLFWRLPKNDGINCLYIKLRLLGYDGSYETFHKHAIGGESLQTLSVLAKQCGFDLMPVKLTSSELDKMPYPVVIHMEDEGIGSGGFSLYLSGDQKTVDLIDGVLLRAIKIPRDRFRRAWTGYALVLKPTREWFVVVRRLSPVLLLGYLIFLLLNFYKSSSQLSNSNHNYFRRS